MSIQASWLDKKWTIDRNGLTAINNFSLTKELDAEEQEAKDGKNPTKTKGFKPQSLVISHKVSYSTGKSPLAEFEEWQARCGKRAGFHIEGRRIGPAALILDRVEFTTNAISNTGHKAPEAAIELYVGESQTAGSTPGYSPKGQTEVKSAYNVRPSASAAEAKS